MGKKGSMIFPAQGARAPRYLHTTCLSCASLLLCAVSVWGWLVHDTLLKIDIRSLYKRRLTKKWEGMKAHKGARECDRQRKTKGGERRKVREEERKSFHCTKLEVRGNKHMQVWNGDGWKRKWIFQVKGMSQISKNVNGDRCAQQRCNTFRRHIENPAWFLHFVITGKKSAQYVLIHCIDSL